MRILGRNYDLQISANHSHKDFVSAAQADNTGHTVVSWQKSGLVFTTQCDYPYSHTTEHLILWYPIRRDGEIHSERFLMEVEREKNHYRRQGFTVVQNAPDDQSNKYVGHYHLLKFVEDAELDNALAMLSLEHEREPLNVREPINATIHL